VTIIRTYAVTVLVTVEAADTASVDDALRSLRERGAPDHGWTTAGGRQWSVARRPGPARVVRRRARPAKGDAP
jgi:hypothetical protein